MLNFYLPNFYEKYSLNMLVINDMKMFSEQYHEDIKIGAIYGTFPNAIWNGGRVSLGSNANNITETIEGFNELDIPLRFTFTNCLLEKRHLYDEYCNLIMEKANNGKNEVLINSPLLEKYLRKNYPNFKYISSTTKCLLDKKAIEKESQKYYLTVLDYRFNNNFNFLESLSNKDKYELLINPYCSPLCNKRMEHYKLLSQIQLDRTYNQEYNPCESEEMDFYEIQKFSTFINNDLLYSKYKDLGFINFKIEGRSLSIPDVVESYVYYLIKPEYQNIARLRLLRLLSL